MVATTIATMTGSALLLAISSAVQTTDAIVEHSVAMGMAQQLMDEIAGMPYCEPGTSPYQASLGPEAGEVTKTSREFFDDLDDFHGYQASPPCDYWGIAIGQDDGQGGLRSSVLQAPVNFFDRWRQQVDVYYVEEGEFDRPLEAGRTSNYRAVRVRILSDTPGQEPRPLAEVVRIFANVPN